MNSRTDAIINEIEKVIIGKRNVVERVLMAILSEGHILLDDVPGTGKTTLALTCSVVMGVQYQRMQFTPCLLYTSPSPRDRTRSRMPSSA